jgi:hypothetical protein
MQKYILACLALATVAITGPASALPRTLPAFEIQESICEEGLEMIIAGETDQAEQDMYVRRLADYGWDDPNDLEDLMLLCAFYKQGWLYAQDY